MDLFVSTIIRYTCASCGGYGYESHMLEKAVDFKDIGFDQYEDRYFCLTCGEGLKADEGSEREARWFSVAFYTTEQQYGGPEEGGWYYTTGSRCDETLRVYNNTPEEREMAERYLRVMEMDDEHAQKHYGSRRMSVRVVSEDLPPSHFPKRRPVYC